MKKGFKKNIIPCLCVALSLVLYIIPEAKAGNLESNQSSITRNNDVNSDELPEFMLISFDDEAQPDSLIVEEELEIPIYDNWEVATIEGKLKMRELPLSPNVKIFMQKDSLIHVSLRAPFVGEAGRLVMTKDTILVINQLNKTYLKEFVGNKGEGIGERGIGIGDIQSLLLARFFVPGFDLESDGVEELIEIFEEDNQINVIPTGDALIEGVKYGYVIDENFKPLFIVVLPQNKPDVEIDVAYKYNTKGYDITGTYLDGAKKMEMTLELKNPIWKGDLPKEIDLTKKYRKVDFAGFMRSF